MEQTTFEYEGAEFFIDFEFDSGEPATYDHPGYPATAEIHSITHNGIEMIGMLRKSVIEHIEHKLALQMLED